MRKLGRDIFKVACLIVSAGLTSTLVTQHADIHKADVQDRDGAVPLPKCSRRHPFVKLAYADSACHRPRVAPRR